jgi:SAM-dependent methyltransferase
VRWRAPSLFLAATLACAQSVHQPHPPRSSEEFARALNDPRRDCWQKPHEVISALALQPSEVIAGIGAGYFSRRVARPAASVLAVDIDPQLLERAASGAPPNHRTILSAPDDPQLDPASVDTVFICDVWRHIDGRPAYLAKLARALRPGGRVVVVDFHQMPSPVGPPPALRISRDEMIAEFARGGFRLARDLGLLPYQYFLVFERR